MIKAARNAIVAPTNAEVNSSARSVISVFIGGLVVVGSGKLVCFGRAGNSQQ